MVFQKLILYLLYQNINMELSFIRIWNNKQDLAEIKARHEALGTERFYIDRVDNNTDKMPARTKMLKDTRNYKWNEFAELDFAEKVRYFSKDGQIFHTLHAQQFDRPFLDRIYNRLKPLLEFMDKSSTEEEEREAKMPLQSHVVILGYCETGAAAADFFRMV